MGMLKKLTWNLSRKKQQAKLRNTNTKTLQFIKELKINITTMFRLNLKLTICNLSRFLQERKLVFSQGSFWEFLVSTDDVCGTKVKLHLQIWFERNDPILLGFPKSCARTKTLCIAPPLGWHKCLDMCRSWLKCMCISLGLALFVPHGTTDQEGLGP